MQTQLTAEGSVSWAMRSIPPIHIIQVANPNVNGTKLDDDNSDGSGEDEC